MREIYIILMDTKTIPSRIVSLFTMYKYSHIAISFDEKCDIVYSFGRRNLYSFLNGGFTVEHKNGDFFNKFNDTNCRVYEVMVNDSQYDYLYKTIDYMKNNCELKDIYRNRIDGFFAFNDQNNCERVYQKLIEL